MNLFLCGGKSCIKENVPTGTYHIIHNRTSRRIGGKSESSTVVGGVPPTVTTNYQANKVVALSWSAKTQISYYIHIAKQNLNYFIINKIHIIIIKIKMWKVLWLNNEYYCCCHKVDIIFLSQSSSLCEGNASDLTCKTVMCIKYNMDFQSKIENVKVINLSSRPEKGEE